MTPLFLISLVVQILLIVHCMRTGRSTLWIWVLLLASVVGAIAYIAVEIVPELLHARGTGRALRGMRRALDPGQQLRSYEAAARRSGDVASRQRYAEELVRQDQSPQAIEIYRGALTGLYEHDPNLLLGLAQAQFAADLPAAARATLDALIAHNPDFRSADGHLLYARALEAEGNLAKALEEYTAVAGYYAGAEAALRHAQLLARLGRPAEARQALDSLLEHARLAPRHYRKVQEPWLSTARRELAGL